MRTFLIAFRTIFYMSGFVFLWGWLAFRVRAYDPGFGIALPAWTKLPGLILIFAGGVLALTCGGLFTVRGQGTPAIFDAPRQFVAMGPYKLVRNPMYIGAWSMLAGFGLYLQSLSIVLFGLLFLVLAHLFVVFYEEPGLARRFGSSYEAYCKAVPRWIPAWGNKRPVIH